MLYATSLTVRHVKCFPDEFRVEFSAATESGGSWTLLLGDNGTGKTSLLRCIALCLCNKTSATGLLTELTGSFIRDGYNEAEIVLALSDGQVDYEIKTTLQKSDDGESENLEQKVTNANRQLDWKRLFACAYGAMCGTIGDSNFDRYRPIDSLYTLFNYDASLQNPETALRRVVQQKGVKMRDLLEQVDRVLMLKPGSTQLTPSGIRIRKNGDISVPVGAAGDGYAFVLSWISDLLGWWHLRNGGANAHTVKGIVLVDEVDRHLHPKWQRRIISLLTEAFPSVQFIGTTHSPLTVIGATRDSDQYCRLVHLQNNMDHEGVTVRPGIGPPKDQRADQVLTSHLFGLHTTMNDVVVERIERYAKLRTRKQLTPEEQQDMDELREGLKRDLGKPETRLQQRVEKALRFVLASIDSDYEDTDAAEFAIRRKVQELMAL